MILQIYTDGGSKGNPGPSSIGGIFYLDKKKVFDFKRSIGIATNNDAEYKALIEALKIVLLSFRGSRATEKSSEAPRPAFDGTRFLTSFEMTQSIKRIEFYSDSRLMVNQVKGLFKVKNGKIREYILKIRGLEQEINLPVSYHLVPRENNWEADKLVNSV